MNLPYGSPGHHAFVTGVGLITSTGPHGENVMAAEWTHMLSYSPGLIGVCLGPTKATTENIRATKEFGVSIASITQNVLSSLAGNRHGQEYDKVSALKELGFHFLPGKKIKAGLIEGSALHVECTLVDERTYGDHVMFVGEAIEVTEHAEVTPVIYNRGKYWNFGENIPKPREDEMEKLKAVMEKYKK